MCIMAVVAPASPYCHCQAPEQPLNARCFRDSAVSWLTVWGVSLYCTVLYMTNKDLLHLI